MFASWLIENFIWVGIAIAAMLIGIKLAIGRILRRLMDASEMAESRQKASPRTDEHHP